MMPTIEEMKAFEATFVEYEARCAILQELIEEEQARKTLDEILVA